MTNKKPTSRRNAAKHSERPLTASEKRRVANLREKIKEHTQRFLKTPKGIEIRNNNE